MRDYLKMVGCSIFAAYVVPALLLGLIVTAIGPIGPERKNGIVDKDLRDEMDKKIVKEPAF